MSSLTLARYCRQLKIVYKTSTLAAIGGNNPIMLTW